MGVRPGGRGTGRLGKGGMGVGGRGDETRPSFSGKRLRGAPGSWVLPTLEGPETVTVSVRRSGLPLGPVTNLTPVDDPSPPNSGGL